MRQKTLLAWIAILSPIATLVGCAHTPAPPGKVSPKLTESLDRILAWHQKNAPGLAVALAPGLSRSEIESLARDRKIVLPEEVYALYGWRNGSDSKPFFGSYRFLPLSEAFKYGDALHQPAPAEPYRLPLFQDVDSNGGYDVLCPREPQGRALIEVPVEYFADGLPTPDMENLTTLVQAVALSFEKGVFTDDADGELDTDEPAFERILLTFRPERKAAVEAVLAGRPNSLTFQRETQAYWDLILTGNPHAEELLTARMDHWLYSPDGRFTGLIQLASLDTPSALGLLEQAARNPKIEVRRQAYSTLAWRVQWEKKKLDPTVEKIALGDLWADPLPQSCEQRDIARVLHWSADHDPVPDLIRLLYASGDDCARDTRIAAAAALGHLGDPSAVPSLLARLKIETDVGTQLALLCALADLGNPEGERQLRARMTGWSKNSLWNASNGGAFGSPSEVRIAEELLHRGQVESGAPNQ